MTHRDARSLDHTTLEEMRRLAVKRVLAGESQIEVAGSLEVSPYTVNKWMRAFREGGEDALGSTKATGRPSKLAPKQVTRLERIIIGKNPRQMNFGTALWTLPIVGTVIEQLFDVVLHKATIGRLLRRMGLTPQKPVRRAFQRDQEECLHWMTTEFPSIVRQSKRRQSVLLFSDETGVHEDHAVGRTWARRGETPVVEITGLRRRTNVISAISPRGRMWFRCYGGTLTADRFIEYLKDLLDSIRKPIDLILDKHPAHTAAKTRRFIKENARRLRVHWLPSYAPHLNPSEHIWAFVKGAFKRSPTRPGEDFALAVHTELADIKANEKTVRSFFGHPEVHYVREALGWS